MNEERPTPRRSTTTNSIALIVAVDVVIVALLAALAGRIGAGNPSLAFISIIVVIAIVTPLSILTIRVPLRRIRRNLGALTDGVRGFADGDFSLRLHVTGNDEITDLIALYNEMGRLLRDQRKDVLQKELLLETVLQTSPVAILLTNERERIVLANRAARDLFTPGERTEGRRLDEVLAPSAVAVRDAFAAGDDAIFTVTHADRSETYHLARRAFYLNTRKQTLWMVQHLTPELRRQEVEVWKRAIRVLNHEINNSLAPVLSLLRSARVARERPEHAHRLAEIDAAIEERLEFLQRFLDGYAQFARLPKPRREEVAWDELLAAVQPIAAFRIADPRPSFRGVFDRTQIEQVVINLVKNANESESAPEDVVVSVERGVGGQTLVVADRGSGMDDDTITRALVPFYSTKVAGTGLGLPLCNEIIEAHGGHMRITRREGGGTAVTCWLPDPR